jgi:hypothetical protein
MPILFYDHLINKNEIHYHIDTLHSNKEHQLKLKEIIDEVIHQEIISFIISKLKRFHHQLFLDKFHTAPYDPDILIFLKENIHPEVEEEITSHFQTITIRIKKDLD